MATRNENELFELLKAGDEQAFEYFFKTYFELLYNYAFQITKDQLQSEEIVSDTFVLIWEKRALIDLYGTPKAYLFKTVYNQCLNYFKHKKVDDKYREFFIHHQPSPEIPKSYSGYPLEKLIDKEFKEHLEKSIDKLPDQCKRIFIMSRFEDKKNKEIAEILGLSVNTVKTQILRALKQVGTDMKDLLILILLKK